MPKLTLYYAAKSSPSCAVLLTAKELDLKLDLCPVCLYKGEHLTSKYLQMNPQHTVPTLIDDGVIIYDSHAICTYLVDKYAKDDQLYPKDLVERAQVDARLHFEAGHLYGRLKLLYEPLLNYGSTDRSFDKIAYVHKSFDIMENFLRDHPHVCGETLTIADFICVSTIRLINEITPFDEYKYPKMRAWLKLLSERESYKSLEKENSPGYACVCS